MTKAISKARLDAYSRDEPQLAAAMLDQALEHLASEPLVTQFRAFVLRIDIAVALGDVAISTHYLRAAEAITLDAEELVEAQEEVQRLRDLRADMA